MSQQSQRKVKSTKMQGDVFQPDQMLRMTISNSYINTKAGKLPYQTISEK